MSEKLTIPPKTRPEWRDMVTGSISHNYNNFVLQMKITQAIKDIQENRKAEEVVVDEIYSLCEKYAIAVQQDFKQIFKSW